MRGGRAGRARCATWLLLAILVTPTAGVAVQVAAQGPPADTVRVSGPGGRPPGGEGDFRPLIRPTLDVTRAAGAIRVDGVLDDPGWKGASRVTRFSENFPDEMGEPPVDSEAWITYDQENLYLALVAYDDPSTIRASLTDRDHIWQDDYFGILLDTYGDASWAVFLFANPLGVQGDSRFASTAGEDDSYDLLYYSEGRITDDGYVVEIRVPFASLRFPDRQEQEWRATFWRTRPRASRAQYTWAAISRDDPCFLCQFGTLNGISGVKPGGALELLPTVVASQSAAIADPDDPRSGLDNEGLDGEPSLGMRYSFPQGLTADLALNPDFSQIESDAAQIDVNSTFALFYPERRPLFQEGSDVFSTWIDQVYTRTINDPSVVGKAIGRVGRSTLGYIGGVDRTSPILIPLEERSFVGATDQSVSNIVRGQQTFGNDSYAGFLATDRRFTDHGGSNTSLGVDGKLRFLDNYQIEAQLVGSHSAEPNDSTLTSGVNDLTFDAGRHTVAFDGESFWGSAVYASLERDARTWNFDFDYWHYSPTFRVDNGFETRNDTRRVSVSQGLSFYPASTWIDQVSPGIYGQMAWNFEGQKKDDYLQIWLDGQLKGQTFVQPSIEFEHERFRDTEFHGLVNARLNVSSNFSDPVRLGLYLARGDRIARTLDVPARGTGTDAEFWGTLKLWRRLVIEPSLQYSNLYVDDGATEVFDGFVLRTRASFHFTRELFARVIVQWDDFSGRLAVEPLVTYRVNPFTVLYVGATSSYADYGRRDDLDLPSRAGLTQTSRQFFLKVQYLLRI
jgi:hypothetical protein